ncbi:MAG: TlpA family protein disulfide reductase [Desulfobulbaceae bacterium]|nr:TlpA family protein disulfide reductase [Desulfobulbaceae bacterium]
MKRLFPLVVTLILMVGILTGCKGAHQEAAPAVRTIGKPAPDFVLQDTRGRAWRLSELKGKVVFVNFWATWCPPCRAEMPSMQELVQVVPPEKFQMLAILSNDQPEVAEKLTASIGFTSPILLDPENRAATAYGITGVPETYIVDKDGVLREIIIGGMHWSSPEARQMLAKYL